MHIALNRSKFHLYIISFVKSLDISSVNSVHTKFKELLLYKVLMILTHHPFKKT